MKEIKRIDYKSGAQELVLFILITTVLNLILLQLFPGPTQTQLPFLELLLAGLGASAVSFLIGMLAILLYNLLAKWVGGVKLDI